MAKKVLAYIKLQVAAGQANPSPPKPSQPTPQGMEHVQGKQKKPESGLGVRARTRIRPRRIFFFKEWYGA